MKTYRVLMVLALVLVASSAVAATGPQGEWPCVFGNNQLTGTHVHATNTGPIIPVVRWEVWYPAEGGPWSSIVMDGDDNIYTILNDSNGAFEKWDTNGNLLWSRPAPSGWGSDTTGVLGNDPLAWYVPSANGGGGDVLLKIDPADGTVLWTHVLGGGGYTLESAAAAMDDAGHIYVRSCAQGFLHRVTDLGASATEDWATQVCTAGFNPAYAPWMTGVDPDQTKVYQCSGPPDYAMVALNASTGAVVWTTAFGGPGINIWQPELFGQPILDDNGDVYAYCQGHADVPLNQGGVCKFDGDTGSILWTYANGTSGAFGMAPCTGALNQAQTRLYHEVGNQTVAIDTATGIAQWTVAVTACFQTNGSVIVDASNNPMVCGGGNGAMCHITDNGTSGSLDWRLDPLAKQLYDAWLDYHGINSDSELVLGKQSPGWNGGLYLGVHYANNPPLAIVAPASIGPLERDIPILGPAPLHLGLKLECKGYQGPVSYTILSGSLPPGMYLSGDYIRGAADSTALNQYTVTFRANDGVMTADKTYVIDIVNAALQVGPGLPLGSVGNAYGASPAGLWIIGGTPPYTVAITAGKGDYVDATSLGNTGLTLNLTTGQITGVPSAISSATVEVTVTDSAAASVTKDITVDVVDSRVWDTFQRTKRRVGTSTLPAPRSYPHNINVGPHGTGFCYNPPDTWHWCYEMMHAPLFAYIESDADGDGEDDGYMFISTKFACRPVDADPNWWDRSGWGWEGWAACPYDVDPGPYSHPETANYHKGLMPNPLLCGGWLYHMNADAWPGVHAPDVKPGQLRLKSTDKRYADRLYFTNDNSGTQGRLACLNANTGALLWSISGSSDGSPWIDRRGYMALLENGDIVDKIGENYYYGCNPSETTPGQWTEALDGPWYYRGWNDTYGLIRDLDTEGKIIWTAGEENTLDRDYVGPIFYNLGKPYHHQNPGYRGALTVFKLADEGELVLAQRGGPNMYYVGGRFTLRADSVQNVTVWTCGNSDIPNGDWYSWWSWTYIGASPRACPVVDSTNNVYVTMDRRITDGSPAYQNPMIWCIDAADAADNPQVGIAQWPDWCWINSDASIKWQTVLGNADLVRVPAGPCLSYDQRTIYTVAVARATSYQGNYWRYVHLNPGTKCQLIALHAINGAVKWVKDLEINGLSGCDYVNDGDIDRPAFAPMADPDNKVLCATYGDSREWWQPAGSDQNQQGPEFNGLLRPMAWCFTDTGSDGTLMWTRAMSCQAYLDRAGPASFAVTPNYRLVFAGDLDPEWHGVAGLTENRWKQTGVRLIHPDDIHIEKVDYNPGVNITFGIQGGANYDVEYADGNAYSDTPGVLTWNTLPGGPWTGAGPSLTVTDTTSPTTDFRFYRIKLTGSPFYSNEICGAFQLTLKIQFAVREFFFSVPLVPDSTATVASVIGDQLPYTNVKVDKLDADAGLYSRATYTPGTPGSWANDFPIVAGEGYMLDVGDAYAFPHTVVLTGFVSGKTVKLSVTRASYAVAFRWMGYSMAQTQTLAGLGLHNAITPWWQPTNEVRLLPLGTVIWNAYYYDGTNWRTKIGDVIADTTPIACGEALLFFHDGIPGMPDQLPLPTWYYKPPVAW